MFCYTYVLRLVFYGSKKIKRIRQGIIIITKVNHTQIVTSIEKVRKICQNILVNIITKATIACLSKHSNSSFCSGHLGSITVDSTYNIE